MKGRLLLLAITFLAGCRGAPTPLPLPELHDAERRFTPPPRDPGAVAQEILGKEELTLANAIEIADLMNPEIASERKNIDLATAEIWEARLYPNPSIVAEFEDYLPRDGTTLGKAERTAGMRLPLVLGTRIGAASRVAEKEREVAAIRYIWRRREILTEVKTAFLRLLAARRSVELARETRDIAKALHDAATERFKNQVAPEMETLKSAVSLAKAEIDLKQDEKELANALKQLQALIGNVDLPTERFAGELVPGYVLPSLDALRAHVETAHPLLEEAARSRESAELQVTLARAERVPDVDVEISGGVDPEDTAIIEGGLEFPVPLFNRNQAKIARAEIRVQQADLQIRAVHNELVRGLTESYRNFEAAQGRVKVYQDEVLPKAQKALDQTNEGYRQGKFGYLEVLDAQRTLAEAKVAFLAALAELNESAAQLEKLTGTALEPVH